MGGQMEGLLRDVSTQLGSALRGMEEIRDSQRTLTEECKDIRERLKALEVAAIVSGQYGSKEHDLVLRRLGDGDKLFQNIQEQAAKALGEAESAKIKINELKARLEEETKKRGKARWDFLKILIECGLGALGFGVAKGIELMLRTKGP